MVAQKLEKGGSLLSQIKTDDALTAAWWHDLQSVTTLPNGQPANPGESVKRAYEHLLRVNPENSIYCIATQTGHQGSPHHKWFSTPVAAATYAVYESLVRHCKNVWYATAGYTDEPILNKFGNPSRSVKNVVGVKALWVDLDVSKPIPDEWVEPIRLMSLRSDKDEAINALPHEQQEQYREYLKELDKYHTQQAAVEGLVDFIQKTGLTPSSVISSGRGLHVYWYIEEVLTANTWKQLAENLKALTICHGLKADPMRTADAASLMRLPGTWHRKGEPLEVLTLQNSALTYKYEAIDALIREKLRISNPSVLRNTQAKHAPTGVAAALIRPNEFPPANAELVATKCQQIRFFRQSRGVVDEPVWYLVAGTMAYCVDGERYYQEWSSGHPNYSAQATQDKFAQWLDRTTGPSSCAAFEGKNPTGCGGCSHKGKVAFPVQLGEEAAPLIEPTPIPICEMADEHGEVESKPYVPPTQLGSFRRTTKGIQVVDDALPAPITICDYDVWITRNSHDKQVEARMVNLCYRDYHGDVFEYQLKASVLSDQKALLMWMYDKGLYPKPEHAKAMSSYLQAYINDLAKNQKTITLHSTMGWSVEHDIDGREKAINGFVLGNRLITKNGTVEAGLSPKLRSYAQYFHETGSRDKWIRSTRIYGEKGLEPHALAFLMGFAAPLMKFAGTINGVTISLVGRTGAGKTSVAYHAVSMYGHPEKQKIKWGDTANAIFYMMNSVKNLPVLVDEFTNPDPHQVSQFAYDVTNGMQRARLNSDASLKTTERDPWNLIVLATTNESLLEKVQSEKADAAAAVARVLEYQLMEDDRWLEHIETELVDVLSNDYGVIGETYLSHLVKNVDNLKITIPKMITWVKENSGNVGQHRFLNAAVACAIVGGHIARKLGLIEFEMENVTQWALDLLRDYSGKNKSSKINPYDVIGTFLAESNGKILMVAEKVNGVVKLVTEVPRGILVARLDMGQRKLYVRRDALDRWMTNRKINHGEVLLQLMKADVLDRSHKHYNLSEDVPTLAPMRLSCYVFNTDKLGIKIDTPDESGN